LALWIIQLASQSTLRSSAERIGSLLEIVDIGV
jgi:hypothetical protein